jgi:5-methylcytosine-specific restriction enzyme B
LSAVTFGYAYLRTEKVMGPGDRVGDPLEELLAATLLDREVLEEIVDTLRTPPSEGGSPQIVLAGPPGTSKTWVAEAIARHIANREGIVRFVQFHPNYSYEAFVEGLRPVAEGGGIKFIPQRGALLTLVADMAVADRAIGKTPLHFLVIDEMNRANLPRVFGELMYLFEYREKAIRLQYSDSFALPANLRFVATMNTADRSIRSIDIALRRRFDVFELRPSAGVLRRFFHRHPLNVSSGACVLHETGVRSKSVAGHLGSKDLSTH